MAKGKSTKAQSQKSPAPEPTPPSPPPSEGQGGGAQSARRLKITAKRDGFRRAGRAWPAAGIEVDPNEFTDEQIAALEAEPMLVVETV